MSGWGVLYAVTCAGTPPGLAPARCVTAAGLRAWGGDDPARAGEVCLKLARAGGCLPAQAGARIDGGANAARDWLRRSADLLRARLAAIGGRVEFVATLEAAEPLMSSPARPETGAGYLRAAAAAAAQRRERQAALHRYALEIADALPGGLAEAPRRVADVAAGRVDLSLLAPRAAKPAFALGLAAQARRLAPEVRLTGSGPWAPHSFADLTLNAAPPQSGPQEIADAARA